jgi:hypothetical protein
MPEKAIAQTRRDTTIAKLSDAFANDLITLEQFEQRVAAAYQAQSESELDSLLSDISSSAARSAVPSRRGQFAVGTMPKYVRAIFSSTERRQASIVPSMLDVKSRFGNVEMDLSECEFPNEVTDLHLSAIFGNIEIRLPSYVHVENYGEGFLGSFTCITPNSPPGDAPVVRIFGTALFGNVEVGSTREIAEKDD